MIGVFIPIENQALRNDGYQKILKYGIAFYRKKCRVMVER